MAVETEAFDESDNKKGLAIRQVIIIEDKKHKSLFWAVGSAMLKTIGSEARAELAEIFECPVHLDLFVQHRELGLIKTRHLPITRVRLY